jgi:hypothetical protein
MPTRQLKQYRRWQSLCTTLKPAEQGFIPTAIEYEDFQQWLKRQDSGYFSDVFEDISEHIAPTCPDTSSSLDEPPLALICRHPIHPVAARRSYLRCPVCTIDIHLNYIKVLTRHLMGVNGRPLPRTGTPSEKQESLYCAWSQAKVSALRQVCEFEDMAIEEAKWSQSHPQSECDGMKTATKALESYWFETAGCQDALQCRKRKKLIAFAEDTNFQPGRPIAYFLKRSPRYEPGKHTVPEDKLEEHNAVSECSEDYAQAVVFVMGTSEESQGPGHHGEREAVTQCDGLEHIEDDDGDSDWEDIDSDKEDDESSNGSYISFED